MTEGKFRQPWLGVLSLLTSYFIAFVMYTVFFNPVGGILSKLVVMDAYVLNEVLPELGVSEELTRLLAPALALRRADVVILNPLGYPLDWMVVLVFGIVWFIVVAVLCAPLQRATPPKQPRTGLVVAALSLVLAFLTFWVLGSVFGMKGYEMLLLGTCGFLVFPIWAMQLEFWPVVPKKPTMHPVLRGAIYTVISWTIAGALYLVLNTLAWRGATFFEMYLPGHDLFTTLLQPLAPFNHYDQWMSLLVSTIAGLNMVGLVKPYEGRPQPVKGILNIVTGTVVGVALWLVLMPVIGSAPQVFAYPVATTGSTTIEIPLRLTVRVPANVTAFLLCIILVLLVIQLPFGMYWFAARRLKGRILALIVAVISGATLFLVVLGNSTVAMALSGVGSVAGVSGLQALAYQTLIEQAKLAAAYPSLAPYISLNSVLTVMKAQAAMQRLATSCIFGWFMLGGIFWLLIYGSFNHWPWK